MKYFTGLLLVSIFSINILVAQVAPDKYWIQFTDKIGTPYSLDNPETFLTERAIQRRANQGIDYTENDLPVNPDYIAGVADAGASLLFVSKWLNGLSIKTTSSAVLDAITALPYVAETRKMVDHTLAPKPKSFFEAEKWNESSLSPVTTQKSASFFNYGNGFTQINQINGIPLHEAGFRGENMVIAVLDGGFDKVDVHPAFDSLWLNGRILGTKDFATPGNSVFNESSHGTSVLSTMGAYSPGQLIGTAPNASYWLLRPEYVYSENVLEEYNWVSAAEFADSVGADVINSSLGYIDFDMPQWDHVYADMDGETNIATIGADIAASKGILVVNSAGNEGTSSSFPYMGSPADGKKVFSIGAVDGNGNRASFSSIGPTYDGRIKPEVMAMGQSTALASGSSSYTTGSGTSFSSPVLAGMATCLWQANPGHNNLQIKEAIMQSGDNALNPNEFYGYGIPDFEQANAVLTVLNQKNKAKAEFVSVSPIPFNAEVHVKLLIDTILQAQIFDISGRKLAEIQIDRNHMSNIILALNNLDSGFYVLVLSDGSQQQSIKLLKK
ncbi:MAG: S8 family serine peptidase [Bacteroidales bacterium]|jgi:subtilisin family serine protease|nr:S8 family serine peptidase [Bacteroidales bacterium]